MVKKYFQRGSGVFACDVCTRRTRETTQPSGSRLCPHCDELAMTENSVLDGCQTVEEIAPWRDRMVEEIVARGGDRNRVRKDFSTLWEGR